MFDFRSVLDEHALKWVLNAMPKKSGSLQNHLSENIVLGHRGFTKNAPENTIQAGLDALEAGAQGIEIDVKCSLDGVPFVFHDETLNRMMGCSGIISELPLSQIQAMTIKNQGTPLCDTIPTLIDFLDAMPSDILINLEMKDFPPRYHGFETQVLDLIRAHQNRLNFVVSSFDPRILMRLRSLNETIPLGYLMAPEQSLFLRSGFLMPMIRPDAIHPHHSMITQELVEVAHQKGLCVFAWTVNDISRAHELKSLGVNGLITDDSAGLVQHFYEG